MPDLIPAQGYAIWRYDTRVDHWHILASTGLSRDYVRQTVPERRDTSVLMDGPFLIADIFAWPIDEDRRAFYKIEGIRAMYVLPLHIGGDATGSLVCYFREPREIEPEEEKVACVLADVVSAALSERKFERFAEAARVVSAELDQHRLLQAVTDAAKELANAQFGEFSPTFTGSSIVRSSDIRKDSRSRPTPLAHFPVVSYLAVPIISRSGEVLGGLFFGHSDEGVFTENEEQIVTALAAQAAVGIENARLYDALTRSETRYKSLSHDQKLAEDNVRFLAEASELLASSLDYETTLRNLADLAVRAIADWCTVDICNPDGVGYRRLAVAHVDPAKVEFAHEFRRRYPPPPERDTVARVIHTGKAEWMAEIPRELIEQSAQDEEHARMMKEIGLRSFIIVPLTAHGRVLGALSLVTTPESGRRLGEADVRLAEELARRAGVAIENARLFSAANAANRAKDEFLATLSHELRTPMTAVLGWARMMKMGLNGEETAEAIDAIEKSATVQMQLIEDILDMSRIMAGKMSIEPGAVDLRTVTEAALTTVRPTATTKGIEIVTSYAPQLAPVLGDGNRLHQVVWNLLTNAIKFTSRGGTIFVRIACDEHVVTVTVHDTGSGIDPEFLPHVFERFRQQDSSTTRAHGGIGIGLAIARYLVELHGGTIIAESEGAGRGATFRVELPVMESAGHPVAPMTAPDHEMPELDGLSVLVVDDEAMSRDVIVAMLRRCHANVDVAQSAAEAHARVARHRPDVIVCDIAMPGEDGYTFVRTLRGTHPHLPVIALTAFGGPEDRDRALRSGFSAYLKKPIDPVTLANELNRYH